jgi:nicotinamide-nucleotide amidase
MRAELVAIGSELLLGDHVDTNSAWISARLAEIGVDVHRHTTVGDNLDRVVDALAEAAARADAVIVTGGLGPTQDDLTRVAVARLAGVALERRPELVEWVTAYFARGGREMPASNLVQADLPVGARVLPPVGTAAGFALDVAGAGGPTTIWCVPGVPREMMGMVADEVVPALRERAGASTVISRWVRTAGMSESAVAELAGDLVDRLEAAGNPTIAFLASKGETRVRVSAKAATRDDALALAAPVVDELVAVLGAGVAGVDDEGAEHAVARLLGARGWTVGVAESVTGGAVGARLVRVPGASTWFLGGLVTYATAAKSRIAGVDADALGGPVSADVAIALAGEARERLGADVGLAVVGVAGPDPQGGREVGTVIVASVLPDGDARTAERLLPAHGRAEVQEWAAAMAVDHLRRRLAREGGGGA